MTNLIDEADEYLTKVRGDNGFYTDSMEAQELVEDLVERLKAAEGVVEATEKIKEMYPHRGTIGINLTPLFEALAKLTPPTSKGE